MSTLDDYPLIDIRLSSSVPVTFAVPGDFVNYNSEPATTFGVLIARFRHNGTYRCDTCVVLWMIPPVERISFRDGDVSVWSSR